MKNNPVILSVVSAAVLFCGPAVLPVSAQQAVPPPALVYQPLSDQQLDQMLAPIALYPDPLLAQILPASTLPTQIVLADRYVVSGGDPNLIYEQPWDPSVQALARYPSVLQFLDNNLAWTTELGEAFINQQPQVMDSIQRLRISAQNFGNLVSTPQEQVVMDDGDIEILPVDPDVIYVPVYQPDYVYYQSGYALTFGVGCVFGGWLNCDFDWHRHHLCYWDAGHPRPAHWWTQPPSQRATWLAQSGTVWQPANHGARDGTIAGDRGWNHPEPTSPQARNGSVTRPTRTGANARLPVIPRPETAPRVEATPRAPVVRETGAVPEQRPSSRGAEQSTFVGGGSSQEAREFSNRGEQSMRAVERPEPAHVEAPVSRPEPAESGSHSSGSQPRR